MIIQVTLILFVQQVYIHQINLIIKRTLILIKSNDNYRPIIGYRIHKFNEENNYIFSI